MQTPVDPKLQLIANRIIELKKFFGLTNIQTNRSQGALVKDLDPVELSVVAALVNKYFDERRGAK